MEPINIFFGDRFADGEIVQACINIQKDDLFVTTLNPILLRDILKKIQHKKEQELKTANYVAEKMNQFPELPTKADRLKCFMQENKDIFDIYDKIETLCCKELKFRTRHLENNLPENLQQKHIALILYYLNKAKEITIKTPIKETIKEEMENLGFVTQSPYTVYRWYNLIGKNIVQKDYHNSETAENLKKILSFLEKFPVAFNLVENKIEELKKSQPL
jgi:hypothetical protein